jgi:hypothetical protein
MSKENLLLSADGDVSLYKVDKEILDNFDKLLDEFYDWKQTSAYDETLFVEFLQTKYGKNSIEFVKVVGYPAGRINKQTGEIEDVFESDYKDTKWYNF